MKSVTLALFVFFQSCGITYAQEYIGVKLTAGVSAIKTADNSSFNPENDMKPGLSGTAGVYYNKWFSKKSVLGIELLFNRIQHVEEVSGILFMSPASDLAPVYQNWSEWNYNYLSVPVYYGLRLKKIQFNLGVQTSVLLSASYVSREKRLGKQTGSAIDLTRYSALLESGGRLGLLIRLSERMELEWNAYKGFTDINKANSRRTIMQSTFGLRVRFANIDKNKAE